MLDFFKIIVSSLLIVCLFGCVCASLLPSTFINNKNNLIEQTAKTNKNEFGYIEYQPNGTLLLHEVPDNATMQSLLLFKTIINAIKWATPLTPKHAAMPSSKLNFKIYGEGVEHKFPPILERIIQRIQSYFSVYKYADTSRPEHHQNVAAETEANLLTSTVLSVEDSGSLQSNTTLASEAEEFTEFISIGENDGFISVGED